MKQTVRGWMVGLAAIGVLLTGAVPVHGASKLHMDFRGASLDTVLEYLSEAAGFIINKQTDVRGTVDIWSKEPLTRDEAVQLLNSALKKNGYAAIRSGRILTIISAENAKSSDLEVVHGGDPEGVDRSDEVVTQVIPVRFASAGQLLNNLQPLLPATASLTQNESANSLILVATRTQIKRVLKIIAALDNTMARATSIKVIPLQHADARQLATAVQQLFPPQGATQNSGGAGPGSASQTFNFPDGPSGVPGFPGGPGQSSIPAANTATATGLRVVAVADEPSNSLIISAAESIISGLLDMVRQIDQPVSAMMEVRAFRLRNADATELAEQLGVLFPDSTRDSTQTEAPQVFEGGPPGGPFGGVGGGGPPGFSGSLENNPSAGSSSRLAKAQRVIAVADPRTSSLLVSANSTVMPQIALLVQKLDSSPAGKETVKVFDLSNADPSRVRQVLEDLFNRNLTARNSTQSASQNDSADPLLSRQTQQQTGVNPGTTGFGAGGDPNGVGGGFGSSGAP
jgi:general secretion pathway protein D